MLALINDTGILVVVVALVMLFGASQIPKLARSIGEANKEFKRAAHDPEPAPTPATLSRPASGPTVVQADLSGAETVTISRSQLDALLAQRDGHFDHSTRIS